jgi:hypothetical protein
MDSTKVKNSNSGDTPEERKDFLRTQSYAPKHLKKIDVWDQRTKPELFGRLGKGMTR